MATASPMARTLASRFACVSITPLGSPVEPDVYCSSARSLALARTVSESAFAAAWRRRPPRRTRCQQRRGRDDAAK